jgi:hypothetical protein
MTDLASIFRTTGMAIAVAFWLAGSTGCALSNSSGSISDSISSPSDWSKSSSDSSSGSSGGGDNDSKDKGEAPEAPAQTRTYQQDVTQLAFTYGRQGGDIGALRSGVTTLATRRGLTNWEADELTCESIGQGVARAGMSQEAFASFSQQLFGNDPTKVDLLRRGYRSGRTSES